MKTGLRCRQTIVVPLVLGAALFPALLWGAQSDHAALIKKGASLVDQGSYQSGIAVLETVLTRDPDNPEVLNRLLKAYDSYSQELMEQGHFSLATNYLKKMDEVVNRIGHLEDQGLVTKARNGESRVKRELAQAKSFLLNPESTEASRLVSLNAGRERYNEAVDHFTKHEYKLAEQLLLESLEFDTSNPYAYELLGELANLKQELEKAEYYYRKAFALNPDPKLRAKFEQLLREKEIEKTRAQYSDEHFIIRYKRTERFEGSKIREYLREAYRTISQDFGFYPANKISAVLYGRDEYRELTGSVPHWSGAMFDGKIRLPVYDSVVTEKDLGKLIHHELTHAFVLQLSQMKCPVWLNEGLAQYEENKVAPIPIHLLQDAVRRDALIDLDEMLVSDVLQWSSQSQVQLFYLQSFSLVEKMIEKYRMFQMKKILIKLGEGISLEQAFEDVSAQTLRDFISEWKDELKRHLS